jgi:hypothetical protein
MELQDVVRGAGTRAGARAGAHHAVARLTRRPLEEFVFSERWGAGM